MGFTYRIRRGIAFYLAILLGAIVMTAIAIQAAIHTQTLRAQSRDHLSQDAGLLADTIHASLHKAMLFNDRQQLADVTENIGKVAGLTALRIYNKDGVIQFTTHADERGQRTDQSAADCQICHAGDNPTPPPDSASRVDWVNGSRQFTLFRPIPNEPGCGTGACHAHGRDQRVIGILAVSVSMAQTDARIATGQTMAIWLALATVVISTLVIHWVMARSVQRPIRHLIDETRHISVGHNIGPARTFATHELNLLGKAVHRMGRQIENNRTALNRQRDEYQALFEMVPCLITVQDRQFRLKAYNQRFADQFAPAPEATCFAAYKGRTRKCTNCPVERTFADGMPHVSEESGIQKDGTPSHWIVTTAPVKNDAGEVVAAMEMSLDITEHKALQERLRVTERQYQAIFNDIPNPVLVLDPATLSVLDCNDAAEDLFGTPRDSVVGGSFLDLFPERDRHQRRSDILAANVLFQVATRGRDDHTRFVNIHISPMAYPDREALLVTTSDITERVNAEQQLIQAGKMATLGEMATGVAHELNQPLSVIKTASSFIMRKISRKEDIAEDILKTLAGEIDSHVDRAAKIINHMREFGRKSTHQTEPVDVNRILQQAFDLFSRQLVLRGIETTWDLKPKLPRVQADPGQLEQVFINLLINARDAIEDRADGGTDTPRRIELHTRIEGTEVVAQVMDTGIGIPKHLAEKIFEPFFTTKRVGRGTGLGLSISYGIVQGFGGTIHAQPEQGPGTVMEVRLPAAKSDAA